MFLDNPLRCNAVFHLIFPKMREPGDIIKLAESTDGIYSTFTHVSLTSLFRSAISSSGPPSTLTHCYVSV